MGLLKKIFMLAFLVILTWVGLTVYSGWQMFEDALAACPLEEKAAQISAQEHFTTLEQLPEVYLDAVLAVEDRSFYDHHGFNLRSTGRAIIRNFQEKELLYLVLN